MANLQVIFFCSKCLLLPFVGVNIRIYRRCSKKQILVVDTQDDEMVTRWRHTYLVLGKEWRHFDGGTNGFQSPQILVLKLQHNIDVHDDDDAWADTVIMQWFTDTRHMCDDGVAALTRMWCCLSVKQASASLTCCHDLVVLNDVLCVSFFCWYKQNH